MSTDSSGRKHPREGIWGLKFKRKTDHEAGQQSNRLRSLAPENTEWRKTMTIDARSLGALRSYVSIGDIRHVDLGKSEQKLAKRPQEGRTIVEAVGRRHSIIIDSASPSRSRGSKALDLPHLAEKTNTAAQNGGDRASGKFGGITRVLGTAKEVRLEKDNHRLKEERKVLRTEYDTTEKAARKYQNLAFRFQREALGLQEKLEAVSLELKGTTLRYEEARSLSETRLKRVLAAHIFVASKADSQSISELIQKVESLNDDVGVSNNAAESDAKANLKTQDGADPQSTLFSSKNTVTTTTSASPEAGNHPDSEATLINPASQDGARPIDDSDVGGGGIASSSAVCPPTAKEARLEKENHKLKEENDLLRSEYNNLKTTSRKYLSDARRFHDKNELLQKTIRDMTVELISVTKRYKEAKSLGESRLKRLLAAQMFLTLAAEGQGSPSLSELVQKVDALNGDKYLRSLLRALE